MTYARIKVQMGQQPMPVEDPVPQAEIHELKWLVGAMAQLCEQNKILGLAANQCGFQHRLIYVRAAGFHRAFINPEITREWGGKSRLDEGSAQWPGRHVTIFRPKKIRIEGHVIELSQFETRLENKGPMQFTLSGLPARVAQHLIDCLDGITIFDRAA